jgi:hypothetical protein
MSAVGNNEERRAKLAAIKDAAVAIYRSLQVSWCKGLRSSEVSFEL